MDWIEDCSTFRRVQACEWSGTIGLVLYRIRPVVCNLLHVWYCYLSA